MQSSLYKPLAENDQTKTNQILSSANRFFTNIGKILVIYVGVLLIVYPFIVRKEFSWIYTVLLIGSLSISYFVQYFFGIVDRLYLDSCQHGYVQYNAQSITLILNAFVASLLIRTHCTIQLFQLVSSLIFLLRSIYLRLYVDRHYHVNLHENYNTEPISQKWNGIAQHVAAVVLDGTDVIVLTLFSTLSNVSIYAVYHSVVYSIKTMVLLVTNGVQALEGELWAKQDMETLIPLFKKTEWIIHVGTVLIFTCTGILIMPFVSVYTAGIVDTNYNQPAFAIMLIAANAGHCLRNPYNMMILAAGHYKQTQKCYIIAAIVNVLVSILAVFKFGLIGVAIGTLLAMTYQTIWMAIYNSKNFVKRSIREIFKLLCIDVLTVTLIVATTQAIKIQVTSYLNWGVFAALVFSVGCLITLIVNLCFYKDYAISVVRQIISRIR